MGLMKFLWPFALCAFVRGEALLLDDQDDSVVIEAADDASLKRDNRELLLYASALDSYQPFLGLPDESGIRGATTGPCFNSKGTLGRCLSFRQCYPFFKVTEVGNWDTWVLGMYDTCSYFTPQGRQMFGVCCTNPIKNEEATTQPPVEKPDNVPGEAVKYPPESSWPPPFITHPPDATTFPPLPTHPPYPGYPTHPTVPPTAKPPPRPPVGGVKPTKPPYKPPTLPPAPTTVSPPVDASCGAKNGYQDQERIVGGHNADVGEWPWIAALFNGGRQFCGGSLIDNIHILSAAHCVAHMSSWDVARLTVRLGDYNIKTNSEVRHIEKKVKRVVRHRGFDSRTLYHDIAILTLDSPVQFSQQIRSICLPTGDGNYDGSAATVIGWGSLRESGPQPAVLQEVNIQIWSNNDCRIKYGSAAPGGIVDHMVCAGQAGRDSCSGDSGGPLMINTGGRWTQHGIVSWGIGCGKGQYPGVYTKVSKFLPWIAKNLK